MKKGLQAIAVETDTPPLVDSAVAGVEHRRSEK